MKVKEIWKKVVAWLINFARVLWADYLKENLLEQVKELAQKAVEKAECFLESDEYEKKKEAILTEAFDKIELPVWLRLFKGAIKSILADELDKIVEGLIGKLKDVVA